MSHYFKSLYIRTAYVCGCASRQGVPLHLEAEGISLSCGLPLHNIETSHTSCIMHAVHVCQKASNSHVLVVPTVVHVVATSYLV